jgi:6-phosphogluconolactonase (cycloisomerase 2 family)
VGVLQGRLDPETGRLTPTGHAIKVPQAVCVLFVTPRFVD